MCLPVCLCLYIWSVGLQIIELFAESVLFQLQHGDLMILVTHLLLKGWNRAKITTAILHKNSWSQCLEYKKIFIMKGKNEFNSVRRKKKHRFCSPYLRQYRVSPPELAVCHSIGQRRAAAAGGVGLCHHRAQRAVHPLDKRPDEAGLSLWRHRKLLIAFISETNTWF